jgi:hypothetical protein
MLSLVNTDNVPCPVPRLRRGLAGVNSPEKAVSRHLVAGVLFPAVYTNCISQSSFSCGGFSWTIQRTAQGGK